MLLSSVLPRVPKMTQDQRVVPSAGAQPNDLVALEVGMVGVSTHTWRLGEAGEGQPPE